MSKGKVLLGLSGGVDSSVTGLILKNSGYQVDALFMRNWEDDDGSPYCSTVSYTHLTLPTNREV